MVAVVTQWEYRLEEMAALWMKRAKGNQTAELNALGAEGWEAVSVTGDPFRHALVLFKRPLPG